MVAEESEWERHPTLALQSRSSKEEAPFPHRSRSRVEPTIHSSDDDDEPLVPVLADSMSTVPASIGALRIPTSATV